MKELVEIEKEEKIIELAKNHIELLSYQCLIIVVLKIMHTAVIRDFP